MSIGDDEVNWNTHWTEHSNEVNYSSLLALDYFGDLLPKDFKVLDIGCGPCKFYPVFKLAGCSEYVGVDFSTVAIEQARKKFPTLTALLMRADEINFNSAFDLAFCCTFLQHTNIETKKKLFPRVQKALKPDGIWVFQEKDDVETSTTFLKENWIKFTESFGFKIVRTTPEGDGRNGFVFKVVK